MLTSLARICAETFDKLALHAIATTNFLRYLCSIMHIISRRILSKEDALLEQDSIANYVHTSTGLQPGSDNFWPNAIVI